LEGRDDTDQRRNQDRRAGECSDRLSREILVLAGGVILDTIMTVLDLTVVDAAIRTLGTGLNASIPAVQWC
jgi:hypothetical protein